MIFSPLRNVGHFITTLYIILKRDVLWLVGVFVILNFTIGGGLFIALVGFSNSKSSNDTGRYIHVLVSFQLAY